MRTLVATIEGKTIGRLNEGDGLWRFEYDPEWAASSEGFDLAPTLPRATPLHIDGGTSRPVQWYFDNLLPEGPLRETIGKDAKIKGDDAFALLVYLGAESAGSLTLTPEGQPYRQDGGLRPLPEEQLSARIAGLPTTTLLTDSPKRMSLAGAQHKLLVTIKGESIFEPIGATPSTHILKPNHPSGGFPSSVINEYFIMRLAADAGLRVPLVSRQYVPQPIYLIERFDRQTSGGATHRRHIIDACQLLNLSPTQKYLSASIDTLNKITVVCTNRAETRIRLFRWLVFNTLIANDDCHLKNLSFYVSSEGIELAPHYDLLSTGSYTTKAIADKSATWANVNMLFPQLGATTFAQVSRTTILDAAGQMALPAAVAMREIDNMVKKTVHAATRLIADIAAENDNLPLEAKPYLGGEMRLLRIIENIVLKDMAQRLSLSM